MYYYKCPKCYRAVATEQYSEGMEFTCTKCGTRFIARDANAGPCSDSMSRLRVMTHSMRSYLQETSPSAPLPKAQVRRYDKKGRKPEPDHVVIAKCRHCGSYIVFSRENESYMICFNCRNKFFVDDGIALARNDEDKFTQKKKEYSEWKSNYEDTNRKNKSIQSTRKKCRFVVNEFENEWKWYHDPRSAGKAARLQQYSNRLYNELHAAQLDRNCAAVHSEGSGIAAVCNNLGGMVGDLVTMFAACDSFSASYAESKMSRTIDAIRDELARVNQAINTYNNLANEFDGVSFDEARAKRLRSQIGYGNESEIPCEEDLGDAKEDTTDASGIGQAIALREQMKKEGEMSPFGCTLVMLSIVLVIGLVVWGLIAILR